MRRSTAAPRFVAWLRDSVGNCCRRSAEWAIVLGWFLAGFWYLRVSFCGFYDLPRGSCGELLEVLRHPRGVKIGPWRSLGRTLKPLELLEASWTTHGSLLSRSWSSPEPKKSVLEPLLARLR